MAGTSGAIENAHRAPRKRSKPAKFSVYVYKVLKQVHPEVGKRQLARLGIRKPEITYNVTHVIYNGVLL